MMKPNFGTLRKICNPRFSRPLYTVQEKLQKKNQIRSSLENFINSYSSRKTDSITLTKLMQEGENLTETKLLEHAKKTIDQLLIYNARRLVSFQKLPYLVVLNPNIAENYTLYLKSMEILLKLKEPRSSSDNETLNRDLERFISHHSDTIPSLSKGFSEINQLITQTESFSFLNQHLRERIAMRLIARQHLTLTTPENPNSIGVIDKSLKISNLVNRCAEFVNDICELKYDARINYRIDHGYDITCSYISSHLEYVLTEVFKNSSRAHLENNVKEDVIITISKINDDVELRVRDRGKGIPAHILAKMFDFSFTTYENGEGEAYKTLNVPPGEAGNIVAGMGYGLPLSRAYIEMFGGSLEVQSYWGWGTDVYIKINGTKTNNSTHT